MIIKVIFLKQESMLFGLEIENLINFINYYSIKYS